MQMSAQDMCVHNKPIGLHCLLVYMTEGCSKQLGLEVEVLMTTIGRSKPEIRAANLQP